MASSQEAPVAGRYKDEMGRHFRAIPRLRERYVVMDFDNGDWTCMDYATFARWDFTLVEDFGWSKPSSSSTQPETEKL